MRKLVLAWLVLCAAVLTAQQQFPGGNKQMPPAGAQGAYAGSSGPPDGNCDTARGNLIRYWNMDETGVGVDHNDILNTGETNSWDNGPASTGRDVVAGFRGNAALTFSDGAADKTYFENTALSVIPSVPFTFTFKIFPTQWWDTLAQNKNNIITGFTGVGIDIYRTPTTPAGDIFFSVEPGSTPSLHYAELAGDTLGTLSVWHTVIVWWDGSAGGVQVDSATPAAHTLPVSFVYGAGINRMGQNQVFTNPSARWDEMMTFNRVLTAKERAAIVVGCTYP